MAAETNHFVFSANAGGSANAGEGERPANSAGADLQSWEEEQKKQRKEVENLESSEAGLHAALDDVQKKLEERLAQVPTSQDLLHLKLVDKKINGDFDKVQKDEKDEKDQNVQKDEKGSGSSSVLEKVQKDEKDQEVIYVEGPDGQE